MPVHPLPRYSFSVRSYWPWKKGRFSFFGRSLRVVWLINSPERGVMRQENKLAKIGNSARFDENCLLLFAKEYFAVLCQWFRYQ